GDDFTGAAVDDVFRQYAAQQIIFRHGNVLDAGSIDVAHVLAVDTLVFGNDDLAGFIGDIETRDFATQALGHERHFAALFTQLEVVEDEEVFQDLFRRHTDRLQQDRDRHLATTVDTEEQDVLWIEFKIQPGTAVRNDACREQQFTRRMRLA